MTKPDNRRNTNAPQFQRLGELDRPAITFYVNGQPCQAMLGDTVLTALLTNDSAVRRTEFSGQRWAGFCLMGACQDCWVRLESGETIRACSTMVDDGMRVVTNLDQGGLHA